MTAEQRHFWETTKRSMDIERLMQREFGKGLRRGFVLGLSVGLLGFLLMTATFAVKADAQPSVDWHGIARDWDWAVQYLDLHDDAPLTDKELRVRSCESTHSYTAVSKSGTYRGAWQFDGSTWAGVADPHWAHVDVIEAPPFIQDRYMRRLHAQRGWQPWPVCGLR